MNLEALRGLAKQGIDPEDRASKARIEDMRVKYRKLRELLDRGMVTFPDESLRTIGDGTWWI